MVVFKNQPCNAGDTGSIADEGNWDLTYRGETKLASCIYQNPSALEPQPTTRDFVHPKEKSCSAQQRSLMLQLRPDTAKEINNILLNYRSLVSIGWFGQKVNLLEGCQSLLCKSGWTNCCKNWLTVTGAEDVKLSPCFTGDWSCRDPGPHILWLCPPLRPHRTLYSASPRGGEERASEDNKWGIIGLFCFTLGFNGLNSVSQPPLCKKKKKKIYIYIYIYTHIHPSPNPWCLGVWPYLEIQFCRCNEVKDLWMKSSWISRWWSVSL